MGQRDYQRYLEEHGPGQWYAELPGEWEEAGWEEETEEDEGDWRDELW